LQAASSTADGESYAAPPTRPGTPSDAPRWLERIGYLRTQRLNRAEFPLELGAAVPRSVRLYTLPPEIVEIVPEYSGYDYVLVGDDIVIIDPDSHEIVAVIPA